VDKQSNVRKRYNEQLKLAGHDMQEQEALKAQLHLIMDFEFLSHLLKQKGL
jgi:hypothetical protein